LRHLATLLAINGRWKFDEASWRGNRLHLLVR
jgi:hypothetical protein